MSGNAALLPFVDEHATVVAAPCPLAADSAFPGFHVGAAAAESELELLGSHRFSCYASTGRW